MRKINFRVFKLVFLFSSLSLATLSSAQSDRSSYWFCHYGAGLSDYYLSGVFKSPTNATEIMKEQDRFMEAMIVEFGRHPNIPVDHKANCTRNDAHDEAATKLEGYTKNYIRVTPPNLNVYATQWTPQSGIKNVKPRSRP